MQRTHIRTKSLLTRMLRNAAAAYEPTGSYLQLDKTLFDASGKVKPFGNMGVDFSTRRSAAGGVVHEMGHAEWDHYIEEDRGDAEDKAFYKLVEDSVVPWIKTHHPKLSSTKVMMEWHGYFVENLLVTVLIDVAAILRAHGIESDGFRFTGSPQLKNLIAKGDLGPQEFGRFLPRLLDKQMQDNLDVSYGVRTRNYAIVVTKGLDEVALEAKQWTAAEGFQDAWWDAIWEHTRKHHCYPQNLRTLLGFMSDHGWADTRKLLREGEEQMAAEKK
jgi:hypothetical protein